MTHLFSLSAVLSKDTLIQEFERELRVKDEVNTLNLNPNINPNPNPDPNLYPISK